jgi:hypothetical protein
MAENKSATRSVLSMLLLGGTLLGLYNVYSDNADVHALAEKQACGARPCSARITRESRSPIGQSFTYQVELKEKAKRGASVDVECQRAYFLLGEYRCTAQGALP